MTDRTASNAALRAALLAGLAPFRREGMAGTLPHAPGLFSYCALARERLLSVRRLPRPVLGVVVSGAKEVWRGDAAERLATGTLFVLPAEVDLDIVNEPDEGTGLYQSLVIEIEPDAIPDLGPRDFASSASASVAAGLTTDLVEATIHAARAIADGPAGTTVRAARLAELLALLHDDPVARPLFDMSVTERVARLVRGGLDADWTAA